MSGSGRALQKKPRAQAVQQVNIIHCRVSLIEKDFVVERVEFARVVERDLVAYFVDEAARVGELATRVVETREGQVSRYLGVDSPCQLVFEQVQVRVGAFRTRVFQRIEIVYIRVRCRFLEQEVVVVDMVVVVDTSVVVVVVVHVV